jgi:hypothetical protein
MKYVLYQGDARSAGDVHDGEFDSNFAAEQWARSWVKTNAKSPRYTLEREDGQYAMTVFRTDFGQWYVTPKVVDATA